MPAEDGAQIHRAKARAASLRSAPSRAAEQAFDHLHERIAAFPDLAAVRLSREIRERGYNGAYTAVKCFVSAISSKPGPKLGAGKSRLLPRRLRRG